MFIDEDIADAERDIEKRWPRLPFDKQNLIYVLWLTDFSTMTPKRAARYRNAEKAAIDLLADNDIPWRKLKPGECFAIRADALWLDIACTLFSNEENGIFSSLSVANRPYLQKHFAHYFKGRVGAVVWRTA